MATVKARYLRWARLNFGWLMFSWLGLTWLLAPGLFEAYPIHLGFAVLLATNALVWRKARQRIEILGLLPQLAILMMWCMPAVHYWLVEQHPGIMETPMDVTPVYYFRVAIPGVLALCWAYFLPFPGKMEFALERETLLVAIQGIGSRPAIMATLAMSCLFGYYGAPWLLPSWMQFLGAVFCTFLYVLVLVAIFDTNLRGRVVWLVGLSAFILINLIRTTMFGTAINVLAVVMLYAVFLRQWSVWKIVAGQIIFGLLLYWLLSFKYEYRKLAAEQTSFPEKVSCFISSAGYPLSQPVSPKIVDVVVSRLNQGRIMAMVLRYVPSQQPFVRGETIWTAVKGALIPRLLWPDKPRAGGVENTRRFMGIENLAFSINLGVVGEAYVNYGTGFIFGLMLVCYVLFFRLIQILVVRQSRAFPLLLLLLPSLLFMVNFVEKDVGIMVNHVVKLGTLCGICILATGSTALQAVWTRAFTPRLKK